MAVSSPEPDVMTPAAEQGGRAPGMGFIMVTVLIDMISIGLIIPVLPLLIGSFTENAADKAYWYGVVAFVFGFASFLGSPILGALSDRYGRRPVLLLGIFGLGLNFFATALAQTLWVLIAVRVIGGGMQANAAVANAYVADISEPAERARRFGLLGAMFGMGFILGPVMGGILGHYDLHLPFFVAGGLAIVNWLYGYFVLPESLPESRRKAFSWQKANPVGAMKALSNLPGGLRLILIIASSTLAQFTLHTTWVLYTGYRFNWTPLDTGLSLFAVGVASAVVQGGLIKHMLRWLGAPRLVQWGMFSSAMGYLLWGLATEGWMMYAVIAVNLLGFGVSSTFQSMVSGSVDERSQGATMGAVASLNSLMAVLAPLVGAPLMAAVSHLPAQDWRVGAPYFFCAAMQAVAAVLAVRWVREHRPLSEQAASLSSKKA